MYESLININSIILWNGVKWFALPNDVIPLIIGCVVNALELLGNSLHLRFRMRLADKFTEVEILQGVAG